MGPVDALRYLLYAAVNARVVQAAGYLGDVAPGSQVVADAR
jgi:hypothetical protein